MAERTRRRASGGTSGRRPRSQADSGGGRLNRDYSGEEYREPGEGYNGEQPTKGLYTAELFEVKDHTTGEGNESVRWGFRLAEGSENRNGDDVTGWPDFIYTNDNTAWKEQQMLVALGLMKPGGKVNLTYEQIVKKAKPCTVRVGVERYIPEDGDPEWRGRMQAFLPLRDAKPTAKSRRAKDDDELAEDVFDGDEDDDEDDDGEEDGYEGDETVTPPRSRRSTSRSRRKPEPEDEDEEEEEPEDEEEDYDPDALAAELEDLSLAALKKRARDEFGVTIKRGMDADAIIDAVLDTLGDEDDEEEDEPEEEPEPPKRAARRGANRGNPKPAGRTRKARGSSDEPPF